jgi:perosamine synthetase
MTEPSLSAILGGSPVRSEPLPLYNTIGEAEKSAVMEVLDSGILSGFAAQPNREHLGGVWIEALEDAFCQRFGSKYAIAVNSATTALHAALAATGIGSGDEVIVPPYTLCASATAVLYTGAVPIFADIDDEIFCLDPASVEANITPYTKGILVVNLYGHPAPLLELKKIADKHGLFLIEDNAQAPGATIDGRNTGTVGDAGIFSLNRHKTIQCGEGGIIITDDDMIATKARLIRNHGEKLVAAMGIEDIANTVGLNYRMTNMEAAVAKLQVEKLDELTAPRVEMAERIASRLADIPGIEPPTLRPDCTHVYYFFAMKYDENKTGLPRDIFTKAVQAEGFILTPGYEKPLYLEPVYQRRICFGQDGYPFSANPRIRQISYEKGICPVVERLHEKELMWTNITYPPLTVDDMDRFVDAIEKTLSNRDALLIERHALGGH